MNWIKSDTLSQIRGVVHGFLNKEFGGDPSDVAGLCGLDEIVTLKQVHGSDVFVIKNRLEKPSGQKGDAIVSNLRGAGIGVFTADCVPILFADKSASSVAAVHAGWRGMLSQVANAALIKMKKNFGVEPEEICAVIGPCIGRCCYEIGDGVASLFINKFDDSGGYLFKTDGSKYVLDLKEANRIALMKEGVRVDVINICTKCDERFNSYRREGKGVKTQLSFIGLV